LSRLLWQTSPQPDSRTALLVPQPSDCALSIVAALDESLVLKSAGKMKYVQASKDVSLEIIRDKTKHMFMFHHQNTEQNHYIYIYKMLIIFFKVCRSERWSVKCWLDSRGSH
jgi:hypothetical protein